MIAIFLVREFTNRSVSEIGRHTGNRDHTTVLHSLAKIGRLVESDAHIRAEVEALRQKLTSETSDDPALLAAVEEVTRAAWLNAREIEGYRRHRGARRYLASKTCMDDIEMARDYLSRVLDDMRGVK